MARKKKEASDYDVTLANVRELLKTRAGRDVIWHILGMCEIYSNVFTGNSQTFYLEGKRAIGLDILQLLEDADPMAYAELLKKSIEVRQARGEFDD